ncbi:MAG: DUF1553 domain-containing protein [Planctomycetota bacterium]|jgi:hypothetical protein
MMNHFRLCLLFFCLCGIHIAEAEPVTHRPFEEPGLFVPASDIDYLALEVFKAQGVQPASLCSDEVFIRRVYLDVTGTLPQEQEVRRFLKNPRHDKRKTLITSLLKRKEFADYWSLKWCDLLRVKAEFPINLWPNAVQAYHRWVHDAIMFNMPYDHFARQMLTSSGSNFRVPQVNFYRAIQGKEASTIAAAVGLTFMGTRLEDWPADKRTGMEAFFSQVAFKGTAEWKEEIVYVNPAFDKPFEAVFPDGKKVRIKPGQDPRAVFADWLITDENPYFAKNIVNRIWSWLLGRGIIHEPDDIRAGNQPVHPKVLAYLEKELIKADYDLKHIYRLILSSAVYQQSCIPTDGNVYKAEPLFACYPVRQLDAEVLIDALCYISGLRESYSSPIPEPFTFIPEEQRSIDLADGSITSQFLEMFGRPSRDTGLESERRNQPSDTQRRHLLNSTHIQRKIQRSWRLRGFVRQSRGKTPKMAELMYLTILSRFPTDEEVKAVETYSKESKLKRNQVAEDLAWALINSKEFLYRH